MYYDGKVIGIDNCGIAGLSYGLYRDISEFIIVTIPEALGVRQTERIIKDFDEYELRVNHLIVNYIIQQADCDFHKIRKEMQQNYVQILKNQYSQRIGLIEVPLMPQEVKGVERISKISEILFK